MKVIGNVVVFGIAILFLCFSRFVMGQDEENTYCQGVKKVEIFYKNYYEQYMANAIFGSQIDETGLFVKVLKKAVPRCCKDAELSFQFVVDGITDIEKHVTDYRTNKINLGTGIHRFYFPEFAYKKERTVYDSQTEFVRLSSSPGHAIVMRTPPPNPPVFVGEIFVKSWAIMIFLITFAWIIGILAWMADHFKNPIQFPNPFYVGMFEGFWWSVVTMTTVGYGDKAPKSNLARLLAVIWIMISTVFLSLFTANATSLLAISQAEEDHTITLGKKIGVMNSQHFIEVELNLGARIIEFHDILQMMIALDGGTVDRLIFPNYLDYLILMSYPEYRAVAANYELTNVLDHPFQIGMVMAQGNLTVVETSLLACLRSYISNFEKEERSAASYDLSKLSWKAKKEKELKTALDSDNLLTMTYYFFMMAAGLISFGLAWDAWKYYKLRHPENQVAADVELADQPVTTDDIHEIPSRESTPTMQHWGTEACAKYKMSIPAENPQAEDQVCDVCTRESVQ